MYCSTCGKEIDEKAVVCTNCGCLNKNAPVSSPKAEEKEASSVPIILGIIGIIFAWIFALVGHATSITGIVLGAKEYQKNNQIAGLVLSIIGEICSVISSLIGIFYASSYF